MASLAPAPMVNGYNPRVPNNINEVEEYEKILKLRDEIFAGIHPRLSVPAPTVQKVSPVPTNQVTSVSQPNVPLTISSTQPHSQLPGLSLDNGASSIQSKQDFANNTQPKMAFTASGIDPVLLTKSDDLVRAELQLQRQRLEKSLRDQFEQKRLDARKRPAPAEAKPDFDVNAVLAKALEIAKPEPLTTLHSPGDDASGSESAGVDSLYSSRGPDSTPEAGELEDHVSSQNQPGFHPVIGANDRTEVQPRFPPHVIPTSSLRSNDDKQGYGRPSPPAIVRVAAGAADLSNVENDDDEEEGEYSPPEAMDQTAGLQEGSTQVTADPRSRPLRRYSEVDENNNIRINRMRNVRNGSPDGDSSGLYPRKKRKLDKRGDKRRRRGSPDVKNEPVSPPPFHDVQPLGSSRIRSTTDNRPITLDDSPTQDIQYARSGNDYPAQLPRPVSRQYEAGMPMSEPRVLSRAAARPMREEADLRRVASMHNMRMEQPSDYQVLTYETPTRVREASYARLDTSVHSDGPYTYDREATQPTRVVQTPTSTYREVYREPDPQIRYVPQPMAPLPVERIVVDQYGRRFREIVDEPQSAGLRSTSTFVEREPPSYYEPQPRPRADSVRVEAQSNTRYVQDMPPPRMIRHLGEPSPVRREVYEPISARAASVQPLERPVRQSVYVDDRDGLREPERARMNSALPATARYEDRVPVQSMTRAASVRPSRREGSVFVEERSQLPREYLPTEQTQYRPLEPPVRYVDARGREVVMESPLGGPRYIHQTY